MNRNLKIVWKPKNYTAARRCASGCFVPALANLLVLVVRYQSKAFTQIAFLSNLDLQLDIGCRKTSLSLRSSTQPSSSLSSPLGRAPNQRAPRSDSSFPLSSPHLVGWHNLPPVYLSPGWFPPAPRPPLYALHLHPLVELPASSASLL